MVGYAVAFLEASSVAYGEASSTPQEGFRARTGAHTKEAACAGPSPDARSLTALPTRNARAMGAPQAVAGCVVDHELHTRQGIWFTCTTPSVIHPETPGHTRNTRTRPVYSHAPADLCVPPPGRIAATGLGLTLRPSPGRP